MGNFDAPSREVNIHQLVDVNGNAIYSSFHNGYPITAINSQQLDNVTGSIVTIDQAHHEVHDGCSFEAHAEGGNATTGMHNMAFRVGSSAIRVHMVIDWSVTDRAHSRILEGATWLTDSGSVQTIVNHERLSSIASILEEDKSASPAWTANGAVMNVTSVTGGIEVHKAYSYASKQSGGDTSLARHEWVLKPGETYVVDITKDNNNCYMGIVLHWYEHTPEGS